MADSDQQYFRSADFVCGGTRNCPATGRDSVGSAGGLDADAEPVLGMGASRLPFQFFYATPTRDIPAQIHKIAPRLQSVIFTKENANLAGRMVESTNGPDVYWQGLPLAVPRLSPLRGNPGFLGFEMFPLAATKTKAPPELFQQLSANDLVYYDWEITEDRIPSWRQMYQLAEIATHRMLSSSNSPSERFITDVAPKLGECVTELKATSPTQMVLSRKSQLGLSSFELVTLTRWLSSTNFPQAGVFPPQPEKKFPGRPATGTPARSKSR